MRRQKPEQPSRLMESDPFLDYHLPGSSDAIIGLRDTISRLNLQRNRDLVQTILITGESGAGKNHLARVIAAHRRWKELKETKDALDPDAGLAAFTGRFAEIHLPALPDQLAESELFGHRRGAFTGADSDRPGLLEGVGREGDVKDILLDEIGDASLALQTKLLAVVETRRFRRLGAPIDDERETSARFIFATNTDLAARCRSKAFREDLLWRLRQFCVSAPALHEQPENIEAIARSLEAQLAATLPVNLGTSEMPALTAADIEWARHYRWPGNIRQMKHAIVLWLFHEGRLRLREVASLGLNVLDADSGEPPAHASADASMRRRLQQAIDGKAPAPGSPNALLREFTDEARAALVRWLDETRPSDVDIARLFPDYKSTRSLRNKLSQWRGR